MEGRARRGRPARAVKQEVGTDSNVDGDDLSVAASVGAGDAMSVASSAASGGRGRGRGGRGRGRGRGGRSSGGRGRSSQESDSEMDDPGGVTEYAGQPPPLPDSIPFPLPANRWLTPEEAAEVYKRKAAIAARLETVGVGRQLSKPAILLNKQKVHWDSLLKELKWMAEDFQGERARHGQNRRKLCKSIMHYHKSLGTREERLAKEQLEKLRRTATRLARDVKGFWGKIDKVVAFKQKLEVDEERKRAMDKHLNFLLQQTERYSTMIAKNMIGEGEISTRGLSRKRPETPAEAVPKWHERTRHDEGGGGKLEYPMEHVEAQVRDMVGVVSQDQSAVPFVKSEARLQVEGAEAELEGGDGVAEDQDVFDPGEGGVEDDESSLAAQEEVEKGGYADELDALKAEAELSPEQLRKLYYGDKGEPSEEEMDVEGEDEDDGSGGSTAEDGDDFAPRDEDDDEASLEEQEAMETEGYTEEVAALEKEGEMSVEELRRLYAMPPDGAEVEGGEEEGGDGAKGEGEAQSEEEDDNGGVEEGEYEGRDEDEDDEGSLAAQEELEKDGYSQEMDLLKREAEMSVEELRKLYGCGVDSGAVNAEMAEAQEATVEIDVSSGDEDDEDSDEGDSDDEPDDAEDNVLSRLEAMDEKARLVEVERPFLLSPKLRLREYQQAGLNWLVSLYDRRLNGILADEMGLGKTIQTISLVAYLAAHRGIWGPHLVVVPTSCIVNWEGEFKRWCPGFKVLTYYGNAQQRKNLRQGWSKPNSFHVVITSYQLVVQDASIFKRKRWFFLILDEAHNIKNFKSQRWQTLLTFNSARRLLLTGTPLQNDLMELWSLMHFLMPHVFRSRKEFSYWFSNPLNSMVEGTRAVNDGLIKRLHTIMRPFLLRRLKKDVEKQLPAKYEHVVMCPLSRRQLFLYEEFMARSSTRAAMAGGNFMGMMNVLMQLRKVCNHPDLFEARPIVSPYIMPPLTYQPPLLAIRALQILPLGPRVSDILLKPLWPQGEERRVLQRAWEIRAKREALVEVEPVDVAAESRLAKSDPAIAAELAALSDHLTRIRREQRELMATISERRCGSLLLLEEGSGTKGSRVGWGATSSSVQALDVGPSIFAKAVMAKTDIRTRRHVPDCLMEMVRTAMERLESLDSTLEKFTCVVPRTKSSWPILVGRGADSVQLQTPEIELGLREVRTRYLRPLHTVAKRQTLFFPDRWLVQYDAGKLQVLAPMLRDMKKQGHRVLIFTQMTRMLDVLEAFLNLHGHTYLRLDGATGVDRRQRLMDRFNNDTKVFCFILSTRSGGLGINLTGADTVIFFDSDWNPAMDAQAQDRAHRIGQTREVHIYRLVSERTIEENILKKARQRRHLDFLAITAGKFTPEQMYNSHSLREMLGEKTGDAAAGAGAVSAGDVQAAMDAMEDEADVEAMHGAEKDVVEDMKEFDENEPLVGDDSESGKGQGSASKSKDTGEGEGDDGGALGDDDLAAFQDELGPDVGAIEARLRPVERFALNYRTVVEPFRSLYWLSEEQRRKEIEEEVGEEGAVDVEKMEEEAAEEEAKALENGEMLATSMDMSPEAVKQQADLFRKERSTMQAETIRRQMTGDNWVRRLELVSGFPFWYNTSTGEAQWERPQVLRDRDAAEKARETGFSGLPTRVLKHIASFLDPSPDRVRTCLVCKSWRVASGSWDFFKRVLPVEAGLLGMDKSKLKPGTFLSLSAALAAAKSGETIVLDPGHHWEDDDVVVNKRLRIVGDVYESSRVVMELSGSILWAAKGGSLQTMTLRRPRQCPKARACVQVMSGGVLDMASCIVNNSGGQGAGVVCCAGGTLGLYICTFTGNPAAGVAALGGLVGVCGCEVTKNKKSGLYVGARSTAVVLDSRINDNQGAGIKLMRYGRLVLRHNNLTGNEGGALKVANADDVNGQAKGKPVVKAFKNLVDPKDEDLDAGLLGVETYQQDPEYHDRFDDDEGRGAVKWVREPSPPPPIVDDYMYPPDMSEEPGEDPYREAYAPVARKRPREMWSGGTGDDAEHGFAVPHARSPGAGRVKKERPEDVYSSPQVQELGAYDGGRPEHGSVYRNRQPVYNPPQLPQQHTYGQFPPQSTQNGGSHQTAQHQQGWTSQSMPLYEAGDWSFLQQQQQQQQRHNGAYPPLTLHAPQPYHPQPPQIQQHQQQQHQPQAAWHVKQHSLPSAPSNGQPLPRALPPQQPSPQRWHAQQQQQQQQQHPSPQRHGWTPDGYHTQLPYQYSQHAAPGHVHPPHHPAHEAWGASQPQNGPAGSWTHGAGQYDRRPQPPASNSCGLDSLAALATASHPSPHRHHFRPVQAGQQAAESHYHQPPYVTAGDIGAGYPTAYQHAVNSQPVKGGTQSKQQCPPGWETGRY